MASRREVCGARPGFRRFLRSLLVIAVRCEARRETTPPLGIALLLERNARSFKRVGRRLGKRCVRREAQPECEQEQQWRDGPAKHSNAEAHHTSKKKTRAHRARVQSVLSNVFLPASRNDHFCFIRLTDFTASHG